jgi:hypothetical protein
MGTQAVTNESATFQIGILLQELKDLGPDRTNRYKVIFLMVNLFDLEIMFKAYKGPVSEKIGQKITRYTRWWG